MHGREGSSGPAGSFVCGRTSCRLRPPSRSATTACSSPTRSRRTQLLSGTRLADADPDARPAFRVPGQDQRPAERPGDDLLLALSAHGIRDITKEEKDAGRALVMRGGPWSPAEKAGVLDYCQTDVDCLGPLLERMLPGIRSRPKGLGQALLRGRYAAAVARMEHAGVPIDVPLLERLRAELGRDQARADCRGGSGLRHLRRHHIQNGPLRRLAEARGHSVAPDRERQLALDQDTFHEMGRAYPKVAALGDLRHAMGKLRLESLHVGSDGRNRVSLMPFRAKTGRNQPSNAKFIFGPGKWLRGLIKPEPGKVLAYIDWSAQEVAIAAALSGDPAMIDDVQSGDPYLALAKMAGLAPEDATKQSHESVRDQCKACVLGANYGMGYSTLAMRIGSNTMFAKHLLKTMAERYPVLHEVGRNPSSARATCRAGWPRCSGGRGGRSDAPVKRPWTTSPCRPMAPRCFGSPAAWPPNAVSGMRHRS